MVPLKQLKDRAQALSEELAAQPRLAVKGVLDTVVNFDSKTLQDSIEDEKQASRNTLDTADWQEGMAAFSEKRKSVFNSE